MSTIFQAASIAARRHEVTADAAGKSLKVSDAGDQISDGNWHEDIGRRMLENMGQAMVPHLEGLGDIGALVEKSAQSDAKSPAASAKTSSRSSAARKSDPSDEDGDVWDKLLNGGLSQKDIEWVRIKSFMDEKKK